MIRLTQPVLYNCIDSLLIGDHSLIHVKGMMHGTSADPQVLVALIGRADVAVLCFQAMDLNESMEGGSCLDSV